MSRSLKKGPYIDKKLIKKIKRFRIGSGQIIKTWSRRAIISPDMIGYIFGVHNGKDFIKVNVTEEMVGHKLGEFSPTTKFIRHGGKKAAEDEKAEKAKQYRNT